MREDQRMTVFASLVLIIAMILSYFAKDLHGILLMGFLLIFLEIQELKEVNKK